MRNVQRGFSLVEAIVSIGLLTGALVTLAHLVAMCVAANASAKHWVLASIAAEQKLEEMRASPMLSDVTDGLDHLNAAGVRICEGAEPCEGTVYARQWSIRPLARSPDAVLLQVRVRHEPYGEVHMVTARRRKVR